MDTNDILRGLSGLDGKLASSLLKKTFSEKSGHPSGASGGDLSAIRTATDLEAPIAFANGSKLAEFDSVILSAWIFDPARGGHPIDQGHGFSIQYFDSQKNPLPKSKGQWAGSYYVQITASTEDDYWKGQTPLIAMSLAGYIAWLDGALNQGYATDSNGNTYSFSDYPGRGSLLFFDTGPDWAQWGGFGPDMDAASLVAVNGNIFVAGQDAKGLWWAKSGDTLQKAKVVDADPGVNIDLLAADFVSGITYALDSTTQKIYANTSDDVAVFAWTEISADSNFSSEAILSMKFDASRNFYVLTSGGLYMRNMASEKSFSQIWGFPADWNIGKYPSDAGNLLVVVEAGGNYPYKCVYFHSADTVYMAFDLRPGGQGAYWTAGLADGERIIGIAYDAWTDSAYMLTSASADKEPATANMDLWIVPPGTPVAIKSGYSYDSEAYSGFYNMFSYVPVERIFYYGSSCFSPPQWNGSVYNSGESGSRHGSGARAFDGPVEIKRRQLR